jgi:hypothetical protein
MAKKGLANGLEISGGSTTLGPCDPGLKGKQTHEQIHKMTVTCADCALNHVSSDACKLLATQTQNGHKHLITLSDVCKLLATQTQNGHNHLITLVDDHSCKASTNGPCNKPQVGQASKAFTSQAESSTRQKVKILHFNSSGKHKAGYLQRAPHHAIPLYDASPTHALNLFTPDKALSSNKLACGKLDTRSLSTLLRLIHSPSHHLIVSRTVILNEEGPTHHYYYILHIINLNYNSVAIIKAAYLNEDKKYISAAPQNTSAC